VNSGGSWDSRTAWKWTPRSNTYIGSALVLMGASDPTHSLVGLDLPAAE
jgi:hypothetical protein